MGFLEESLPIRIRYLIVMMVVDRIPRVPASTFSPFSAVMHW